MRNIRILPFLCLIAIATAGCVKTHPVGNTPQKSPLIDFDWKTTKQVQTNINSDNGETTPIFIYDGNTLVAAGYTPFTEKITVPVSTARLSVTSFPKDPTALKGYDERWIWPVGESIDVTLANGITIHVSGLIDLHPEIFVNWEGWQLTGRNWESYVNYWNGGATQNSSIILFDDKLPFVSYDGTPDVEHTCLWPLCGKGAGIGGTSTKSGTYLFEDLFPSMGDYDMNDMVIEEHITTTVGADNKVKTAEILYQVNAVGSGVDIAAAVSFPNAKRSDIEKVELFRIDASGQETPYVCDNTSGLFVIREGMEVSDDNEAIIPLFENIRPLITHVTVGKFFNTSRTNGGTGEPIRIALKISFTSGSDISADDLTDLFIMPKTGEAVNNVLKWRGHEIHLSHFGPTSKMDTSLFGTGHTASAGNSGYGKFKTKEGYVWAIYVPVTNFGHPLENEPDKPNKIFDSYPRFKNWIESAGTEDTEWYLYPDKNLIWE